jgi:general secretion pathway protein F
MAAFEYQALTAAGKKKKGVVEAESLRHARQVLREQGLIATSVDQVSEKEKKVSRFLGGPGMSSKELTLFTRQMATLVQAAMPLEEVLQAVAAQSERPKVKSRC